MSATSKVDWTKIYNGLGLNKGALEWDGCGWAGGEEKGREGVSVCARARARK
jgi:hypothetical protein